jgi:hypothetical protein
MDIMSSGLFTAVPGSISTISGIVVGGWLVDFLIQKGHSNTKVYQTIIAIGMSLGFAFLGAVFTHNIMIGDHLHFRRLSRNICDCARRLVDIS